MQWLTTLERTLQRLVTECSCCYLHQNEHTRAKVLVETREARFNKWFTETYPHVRIERSAPTPTPLAQREIGRGNRADAPRVQHHPGRLQPRDEVPVKPGVTEFEVEAEYLHEFVRKGSRGFAYTPIVASGANACVLHYIENSAACKAAGDVLLMDVGAEYGNYASDMTRCLPVSGRFTDRQRKVYDAVHSVMRDAIEAAPPRGELARIPQRSGGTHDRSAAGIGAD